MFELHLFVAIIIDSFFVIQIIKFILPIAVHSLPARKCTLPVSRLLDTNVSTESRCNAEASSSIPSSLITRRRVIILEKEVTAVATQFPTQNEKPEREHVEGMMHAEATFSGRRLQCTLVGLDSRVSRTHTLYPELSLALIVIHWKPETIESCPPPQSRVRLLWIFHRFHLRSSIVQGSVNTFEEISCGVSVIYGGWIT